MVLGDRASCPKCGGQLKRYDAVERTIRTKIGKTVKIKVRRLRCTQCGAIHRELPEELLPFKQYEAEIIFGVLEGLITSETLGYEDYPCEATMNRWRSQKAQLLLWRNPYVKGDTNHETSTCGKYTEETD